MFCEKCGTQLPDNASFCNKCGNNVKKRDTGVNIQAQSAPMEPNRTTVKKKKKGVGIFVFLFLLIAGVVIGFIAYKSRPTIYGTWTDANKTITFSFEENGELRVSGPYNFLGAELFQFTEEDGTIYLNIKGVANTGSIPMTYTLSENTLNVTIMGYTLTLYKVQESDTTGNAIQDIFEDAMDIVQISSLYGTWSDNSGTVSFTFYENGKIRISGLSDMLNVDAFTFTEIDADTLHLKADTDNAFLGMLSHEILGMLSHEILGMLSLEMDYEISGNTMHVSIAGQNYQLVKQN